MDPFGRSPSGLATNPMANRGVSCLATPMKGRDRARLLPHDTILLLEKENQGVVLHRRIITIITITMANSLLESHPNSRTKSWRNTERLDDVSIAGKKAT